MPKKSDSLSTTISNTTESTENNENNENEDDEIMYEVEKVLKKRYNTKKRRYEYFLKWKDFPRYNQTSKSHNFTKKIKIRKEKSMRIWTSSRDLKIPNYRTQMISILIFQPLFILIIYAYLEPHRIWNYNFYRHIFHCLIHCLLRILN